jgi:hypothetical protein
MPPPSSRPRGFPAASSGGGATECGWRRPDVGTSKPMSLFLHILVLKQTAIQHTKMKATLDNHDICAPI